MPRAQSRKLSKKRSTLNNSSAQRPIYLVSGDPDIVPVHSNLIRTGRRVRHDRDVDRPAHMVLKPGRAYVVIGHGDSKGTVKWFHSGRGVAEPWLWVGMKPSPAGSVVYLYSCKAGALLPRSLRKCASMGHVDVVPMPKGEVEGVVIGFLDQVDRLFQTVPFDSVRWNAILSQYVDNAYIDEVEKRSGILKSAALLMLRQSLET